MKFDTKYPNANDREYYEYRNYIWVRKPDNCYICGQLTHFVELNAETYICSEECDEKFYSEMFKNAIKK